MSTNSKMVKVIAIIALNAFCVTQCGIGWAAPYKAQNLRQMGKEGNTAKAGGELEKAVIAAGAGNQGYMVNVNARADGGGVAAGAGDVVHAKMAGEAGADDGGRVTTASALLYPDTLDEAARIIEQHVRRRYPRLEVVERSLTPTTEDGIITDLLVKVQNSHDRGKEGADVISIALRHFRNKSIISIEVHIEVDGRESTITAEWTKADELHDALVHVLWYGVNRAFRFVSLGRDHIDQDAVSTDESNFASDREAIMPSAAIRAPVQPAVGARADGGGNLVVPVAVRASSEISEEERIIGRAKRARLLNADELDDDVASIEASGIVFELLDNGHIKARFQDGRTKVLITAQELEYEAQGRPIVVIDDDIGRRAILVDIFNRMQYFESVEEASSIPEALTLIAELKTQYAKPPLVIDNISGKNSIKPAFDTESFCII